LPETRFVRSGGADIAYQIVGDGPIDVVLLAGWISHCEIAWELPENARFLEQFAEFSRVFRVDRRGVGMSDRTVQGVTLDDRIEDLLAVLDAGGSERAAICAWGHGVADAVLLAATYPHRVRALVLGAVTAKVRGEPGSESWGADPAALEQWTAFIESRWGRGDVLRLLAPSVADDQRIITWWQRFERNAATPNTAAALFRELLELDIRDVLPAVQVPTLVIHRQDAPVVHSGGARWFAEQIPGSRYVELPGTDTLPYFGDADRLVDEIRGFLTGIEGPVRENRVLATVVFIDVVESTRQAERLGDRAWNDLLQAYRVQVRRLMTRFRGNEVDNAGDGFLVTFDGPARGVRFALASCEAVRLLGLEIRAGVHTGEIEMGSGSVSGIAVHVGARVASLADPSETLVTTTVRDLVLGSRLSFLERGVHRLKGVEGEWHLLHAVGPDEGAVRS